MPAEFRQYFQNADAALGVFPDEAHQLVPKEAAEQVSPADMGDHLFLIEVLIVIGNHASQLLRRGADLQTARRFRRTVLQIGHMIVFKIQPESQQFLRLAAEVGPGDAQLPDIVPFQEQVQQSLSGA